MENTLLIGMTRQMALRREMAVIANNLANVNTTGYKSEQLLFEEYMMPNASKANPNDTISFVRDYGMIRNTAPGRIEVTENPLDVAITGEGYFKIETAEGTQYTRNGAFQLDAQGRLVTGEGNPVLSAGGTSFTFGTEDGPISISGDGTISTNLGARGQLSLVQFENERDMQKAGATLLKTDQVELPVETPVLLQGAIESSNVQAILEMTNMISVMQAYQSASKIVEKADELQRSAISKLADAR